MVLRVISKFPILAVAGEKLPDWQRFVDRASEVGRASDATLAAYALETT
jgi:hypothetical protein